MREVVRAHAQAASNRFNAVARADDFGLGGSADAVAREHHPHREGLGSIARRGGRCGLIKH